jgi:rhamnose utilization protein RhaD (predicted bifunctional aldolase and dehydrogenase)/NAD(P)-dependent dehydrogenase (short-subunit alcohol dehydrogenase family)
MENRWSDEAAAAFAASLASSCDRDLAACIYASRLIGSEAALVLHGGGNTSVKTTWTDGLGEKCEALFVKASGRDLATIDLGGYVAVDLPHLRRLRHRSDVPVATLERELRRAVLDPSAAGPSIEAPIHAFLPARFVDHTHADAILALTNRADGERHVRDALGDDLIVLPYLFPGFELARAAADAVDANPAARAMVWIQHGIVTWGATARESYDAMIDLVSRAEDYLERNARRRLTVRSPTPLAAAEARLQQAAPIARGLLSSPSGDADRPYRRVVLRPLVGERALEIVDSEEGRALVVTPPLTTDHLIRTRPLPAWVAEPDYSDPARLRAQIEEAVREFANEYRAYLERHAARMPAGIAAFEARPTMLALPGLGILCAGEDGRSADIVRDITAQTIATKARIFSGGSSYQGVGEEHLFDMEYRALQHAKLGAARPLSLAGHVALVTGAAGAIGSGLSARLAEEGAHVALTDLPGPALDDLVDSLSARFPGRVTGVPLDVTDEESVAAAFASIVRTWGGLDLFVINAGLAHVSSLGSMDLRQFARLQRVNTEGTLLLLKHAARHLEPQGMGGDIVLVSTKNVFAPGAGFGAYSATKAAAHQLARIASLELAPIGVRVNMVAPDAVFSHGERPSGLWAEVGPDRMRARGLDAAGLEEYYRNRNLLKARITADHVANAVMFFFTRQTPTTGATIPVDGGLPDATPR